MPDFIYRAKNKLKSFGFIRENYRRLRKIFLHLVNGRFYQAAIIANHYNPIHRLLLLTPYYFSRGQKKNYKKTLHQIFNYENNPDKLFNVGLVMQEADYFPKSSAFIRLIAPLTHPSIAKDINISFINPRRSKTEPVINVYVVQRTAFKDLGRAKNFYAGLKKNKAFLIIDNDDAFSEIPSTHPEYKTHRRMLAAKEFLLDKADQIWLSEPALIPAGQKNKSFVVPNSLDERVWKVNRQRSAKVNSKQIQMVYMGTATHDADLKMILPALDKVYAKHPGSFQLTTIGVSQDVPSREWIKQLNTPRFGSLYPNFVEWFLDQGPFDVGLSPLVDSPFNRSKSDIKCLDYLAAGIVPLVSDILPYQSEELKGFIIKSKNDQRSWEDKLTKIVADPDSFRAEKARRIKKAQSYIWQKRSSKITARILLDRLQKLAG